MRNWTLEIIKQKKYNNVDKLNIHNGCLKKFQ